MRITLQSPHSHRYFGMTFVCWLLGLLFLAAETKSTTASSHSSLRKRKLIIGGGLAGDRFPYYVALKDANREIQCGGTLIAPDIVLTAAHCKDSDLLYADVGKYSNIEEDNDVEIEIMNPLLIMTAEGMGGSVGMLELSGAATIDKSGFIHPDHNFQERSYDVMLMKLKTSALGRQLVRVNTDAAVPVKQPGGRNEITIIGMGTTGVNSMEPKPDELKQVHVDYLTYEECIQTNSYNLSYKYELLPHMMCTFGAGIYSVRGQCYGDSGGPYILKGEVPADDVQVAVVSWAVNCANEVFPMVGSRTSDPDTVKFIKEVTCSMSSNPPADLCAEENNSAQNLQSRIDVPDGVKVSVRIFADPFGHELKWRLQDRLNQSIVYAEVPYGEIKGDHMFQDVIVPPGGELKFTIDDAAQDGIFGDSDSILYEIVLPDQNTNGEIVVVAGNGQFGSSKEEEFRIPQIGENAAAIFRAANEDVVGADEYATVVGPTAPFKIYIKFADYHEDAAWKVTSDDGTKIYASKHANDYRYGNDVTEEVELPPGKYQFTISDRRGTDDYRAFNFYKLSYLNRQQRSGLGGEETVLYKSDGLFEGESISHAFEIPVTAVGGTSPSTPSADQGIVIGDLGFLEEAQLELCKEAKNYCTKNDSCCSNICLGFRCQPGADDVSAASGSVASGGRERSKTSGYGGSAHRGGFGRA
eukprot:CAMPEP_0172376812 /NCGR_PEP_ID=MMETSP1060-20121228/68579_1 /TAXON_ID=37318 /ORGANISM="Pseudo-nitzschia pungens, Strain cf. cingulata" /LENGTH=695 /DNA_ID=CAMNT_0013104477 /DNA_START=530 /DNA_END=2617 /DNA_ORIENTATION=+